MHLTYEHDYRCREDGRYGSLLSACCAMVAEQRPLLAFSEKMTAEAFPSWQAAVRDKVLELLCMPEKSVMRPPVKLGVVRRDGYRVEKWEFFSRKIHCRSCADGDT